MTCVQQLAVDVSIKCGQKALHAAGSWSIWPLFVCVLGCCEGQGNGVGGQEHGSCMCHACLLG
jgi:hypothetical protein